MTQGKSPDIKTLPIGDLVEDYQLHPRAEVDGSTVEQFREALKAGAKFPPIRVCTKTLRIIDGSTGRPPTKESTPPTSSAPWRK